MNAADYTIALTSDGALGLLRWRVTVSERRRTIGFTAEPGGALTIAVPYGTEAGELVAAVKARLPWMVRAAGRQLEIAPDHAIKEILNGENFPYLGRPRRLVVGSAADDGIQLIGDRLFAVDDQPARVAASIVAWYRGTGATWLRDRVPLWARRLGVRPVAVNVDDLGARWGQCATSGEIVLHWAAFQLSPHLIDFIVVHELAHLAEPHHGPAFHRMVGRVLPDHSACSDELARAGRRAWLGEIPNGQRGSADEQDGFTRRDEYRIGPTGHLPSSVNADTRGGGDRLSQ